MKLYTDDRLVPYKNTTITALSTRAEIDGVLARWGIKKVAWSWDPEHNEVSCQFQILEVIDNKEVSSIVKVEPPRIWSKGTRKKREEINWNTSMRVMFWFIKTHLEMAYLMQSDKTTQFLPYIQVGENKVLKDILVPKLSSVQHLLALEEKVIEGKVVESKEDYNTNYQNTKIRVTEG